MRRLAWIAAVFSGMLLAGCSGMNSASSNPPGDPGTNPAPPPPAPSLQNSINHIIFMVQENRGFDHYFGHMNEYRAANGFGGPSDIDEAPADAWNPDNNSKKIHRFHLGTECIEGISPDWLPAHVAWNRDDPGSSTATLDGFVHVASSTYSGGKITDKRGVRTMGYYDETDLPYYYFMASEFATSDRWFSPVMDQSEINRIYLHAATSRGHVTKPHFGDSCCTSKTIFHELEAAGVSWKIYYTDTFVDPLTGAPNTPLTDLLQYWTGFAQQHSDKIVPVSQYFSDVAAGTLPEVAFIQAGLNSGRDEHTGGQKVVGQGGNNIQVGANYVSTLINALMGSKSWKDSAFILSWDEDGETYDHVAPQPAVSPDGIAPLDLLPRDAAIQPPADFNRTGYRVPLIVISPFTKAHYVSHTVADYTAILKLIETRFNLPALTARDAAQMDMTEFFDFAKVPWKTPPSPPAQTMNEVCDPSLMPANP